MDIIYLPMRLGFFLLSVFASSSAGTPRTQCMRSSVCALQEAIGRNGVPEIMNTDKGSHFMSLELTGVRKVHDIAISIDGKGCWRDNVLIERS